MSRYFVRRILETIPLMLIISIFVFMFIHLIPGDPARSIAGLDAEEWEVEAIREEYGLNKPIVTQYVDYMVKLFHGDMGRSMKSDTPVTELIADRMPQTLKLVFAGVIWAPALGIFIGVISAIKHGKLLDHICMLLAITGLSAPGFWLGLMGIQIFSVQLGWLPSGGLLSGSVLTETVFSIPGMGRLLTDSIQFRDYAVIQGLLMLFALQYVLINLIVDLLYGVINPKIRLD